MSVICLLQFLEYGINLTDNRFYGRKTVIEYNHGQRSLAGFGP